MLHTALSAKCLFLMQKVSSKNFAEMFCNIKKCQ